MAAGSVRELSGPAKSAMARRRGGGAGDTSRASMLSPDLILQNTRVSLTLRAVVRLNVSDLRDAEG